MRKGWPVGERVVAEMVATVGEVVVRAGDAVAAGDTIVVLESMKMEIPVLVELPGTVASVEVTVGDVIRSGDLIAVIS